MKIIHYLSHLLREINTLIRVFWSFKSGFLPVFLETLIKHFILLVLVYLLIIYGSAYFIFKMHGIFYHDFGYIVTFVTLSLVYDLPLIVHHFALTTPLELGTMGILMKSLDAYFVLHWGHVLALTCLFGYGVYTTYCVCRLVYVTLKESDHAWDRFWAYVVLILLLCGLISFFVYTLHPFFVQVYNQGWASAIVKCLWQSLHDILNGHRGPENHDKASAARESKHSNFSGKAYSPKEQRTWSEFMQGKPKPNVDKPINLQPKTPREGMHGMAEATRTMQENISRGEREHREDLQKQMDKAVNDGNWEEVTKVKGEMKGASDTHAMVDTHIYDMLKHQNDIQNSVEYGPQPCKSFHEASVRGFETFNTKAAESVAPYGSAMAKVGLEGAAKTLTEDLLKGGPRTKAHLEAEKSDAVFVSKGVAKNIQTSSTTPLCTTKAPLSSNVSEQPASPRSPGPSPHNHCG